MKAYVYFWDGYRFGARIVTDREFLEKRLVAAIDDTNSVGVATAAFVVLSAAHEIATGIWPPPPASTVGGYVTAAEQESEWPRPEIERLQLSQWEAGVFIVNVNTGECRITGGMGFDSEDLSDCNPRALREVNLLPKEDT